MSEVEFANAYNEKFSQTVAFMRSRAVEPSRAEELAQAAWSKAWERRNQLRDLGNVAAWVNTIALNVLRGELRRTLRQTELKDWDKPDHSSVEQWIDAKSALRAMRGSDRRIMALHAVFGLTSKEIASKAKISAVAVRVRLHRAKLELRKHFAAAIPSRALRQPRPRVAATTG